VTSAFTAAFPNSIVTFVSLPGYLSSDFSTCSRVFNYPCELTSRLTIFTIRLVPPSAWFFLQTLKFARFNASHLRQPLLNPCLLVHHYSMIRNGLCRCGGFLKHRRRLRWYAVHTSLNKLREKEAWKDYLGQFIIGGEDFTEESEIPISETDLQEWCDMTGRNCAARLGASTSHNFCVYPHFLLTS
jgi:hypothetical protein